MEQRNTSSRSMEAAPRPSPEDKRRAERPPSLLGQQDLYLFNEGSHCRLYRKLGAHLMNFNGREGVSFAVWAPNAEQAFVLGDFNNWNKSSHPLYPQEQSGIWQGFYPEAHKGSRYKYHLVSRHTGYRVDKADPFGFYHETPPLTASIVWDLEYDWTDRDWMAGRHARNALASPFPLTSSTLAPGFACRRRATAG